MKESAARLAYGAVEVATLGRGVRRTIDGEPIRFPARWSRYYPSRYQVETYRFLREHCRPGGAALDVGAHIGLFSVIMGRAVGPGGAVASFEPTPETTRVLERTIRLNGLEDTIDVHGEAVTKSTGTVTFYSPSDLTCNANSLVAPDEPVREVQVPAVSLDDFVQDWGRGPTCLKIDAEGAEIDVLEGAAGTIAGHRPAIALDVHPAPIARSGRTLADLWELLVDLRLEVLEGGQRLSRSQFCEMPHTFDVGAVPIREPARA